MSTDFPLRDTPQIAKHAHERWQYRARPTADSVRRAWKDGDADDRLLEHIEGDEARYHEESETVLIRKDTAIVTVFDAETLRSPQLAAVVDDLRSDST